MGTEDRSIVFRDHEAKRWLIVVAAAGAVIGVGAMVALMVATWPNAGMETMGQVFERTIASAPQVASSQQAGRLPERRELSAWIDDFIPRVQVPARSAEPTAPPARSRPLAGAAVSAAADDEPAVEVPGDQHRRDTATEKDWLAPQPEGDPQGAPALSALLAAPADQRVLGRVEDAAALVDDQRSVWSPAPARGGRLLEDAELRALQRRHGAAVELCYERLQADPRAPSLPDKAYASMRLGAAGVIKAIEIEGAGSAALEGCLRQVLLRWRFPPDLRAQQISFPIVYITR